MDDYTDQINREVEVIRKFHASDVGKAHKQLHDALTQAKYALNALRNHGADTEPVTIERYGQTVHVTEMSTNDMLESLRKAAENTYRRDSADAYKEAGL